MPKELPEIIVFAPNSELKSAQRLGFPTFDHVEKYKEDYDGKIIIRWGYGYDAKSKDMIFCDSKDFENVVNPVDTIQLNVRKHEAIQVLSKVVKTPKIYLNKVPSNRLVVYRPTAHAGGKDFNVKRGPFNIPQGYYATQFIKTNKEVRVFVCGNKTLTCSREKAKKDDSDICRSNWRYVNFRKTPKNLHKMVLRAAKKIGLECCAFDILVVKRKYIFLEGNAAPTLEKAVTQFYKKNLVYLINKKFPQYK
jgi:hypothetical protein